MTDRTLYLPLTRSREHFESSVLSASSEDVQLLSSRLRWDGATVSTLVATNTGEDDVLDFGTGHKVLGKAAEEWLYSKLKDVLAQFDAFVMVEDWTLRRGVKVIQDYDYPAVYFGEKVYQVVRTGDPHFDLVALNLSPRFVAFVIEGRSPAIGSDLSAADLEKMAGRVLALHFGVYDGEGFVFVRFPTPTE